ncbi:MAG: DNA polymerase I [Ignavibacteriales bacterium]|nr:DNA polymerase I [Ignavibacteriales bacterium]
MTRSKRLFLLDGMAIAYRSYFAFIQRPLMNSKGENTSAIYGFVTFLNKILDDENPDYIGVAMDTSAPTFRHKAFKDYKATRQKMPEDMAAQLDILKEVIHAYGIPVIEVDGYEADDVMGTLARRAERENVETYLVTSDKDFMQLVSKGVRIYKPGRQGNEVEVIGFDGVEKKFGVTPDRVVDVLGLIGDKSDNVPGVPGIGEKTAIPLIKEYGTLENLLENIESIPQKGIKEKLKSNKDKALLSKTLVTIDTNVPVDIDFHRLKAGTKETGRLKELFDRLEFRTLAQRLLDDKRSPAEEPKSAFAEQTRPALSDIHRDHHSYVLVSTEKEFANLCRGLSEAKQLVFDTETTSTNPLRAEIVGISFSIEERKALYVPVSPRQPSAPSADLFGEPSSPLKETKNLKGLPAELVLRSLKPILENERIKKIGQNIKYDLLVLSRNGIWVRGIDFDTMVASYILREDAQHNLDALAREYLDYKTITYDELTGTGKERKDIGDVPLQAVCDYSCEDADITLRVSHVLRARLEAKGMTSLARDVEFPLIEVLARMESAGVSIDVPYLEEMSKELERTLDNLTKDIHRHAGEPFNINSTQQLSEVLFTRLKLSPVRKTKTGFSTDVAVLEALRSEHPVVELLLEYRQLAKLKSTYVDALPLLIHPETGRVHTSFNQTVASTGRLSSSDPNLQNIPIRTEIGRSIRKAFIPRSASNLLLSADYSQIELRVMAHMCGDEGLRDAFLKGEDIHSSTASKVFGVSPGEVTKEMRRKAKEVNFGIMYGIGPFGLSRRLEISQSEAKEIIDRYFERFPGVKRYIGDTIEKARQDEFVTTLLGRRRYLPEIKSRNQNIRGNAERQAINMPIQGTSADMIKIAMVRIDSALRDQNLTSAMVLQVHDELVFDVPRAEEGSVRKIVTRHMKEALQLSVPIEVEIGSGKNWLEAD